MDEKAKVEKKSKEQIADETRAETQRKKATKLARKQRKAQTRASFKSRGHKLGAKNKSCKRCNKNVAEIMTTKCEPSPA